MKTKEELNALKAEYESLNKKLGKLTDDEMEQVTGGIWYPFKEPPTDGVEKQDQASAFIPCYPGLP